MLEILEPRQLLTAIQWSSSTSGSWDVASNWNTGTVPGVGDDVTIDVAGVTVSITTNVESIDSINSSDPLNISGGGLTVAADSTLTGGLVMTGGSLTARGAGDGTVISFTVTGTTTISSASLHALGGATLSLPQLTSYASTSTSTAFGSPAVFEADGAKSELDLSALTTETVANFNDLENNATNGGTLDLSSLTSPTVPDGCRIDLTDTGGSQLLSGGVTTLNADAAGGIAVSIDGSDSRFGSTLTSFNNSYFFVNGGTSTLSSLTSANGAEIMVSNGATLALPGLKTFDSNGGVLQANGIGSVLDVSALTSVSQQANFELDAINGGVLKVGGLSSLTSTQRITVNDTGGSTIEDGALTSVAAVRFITDGTDPNVANSWTSFSGQFTLTGGMQTLPELTSASFSYVELDNASTLNLPLAAAQITNTGDMLIAPGGTLDIAGNLKLTSTSTLDEQIGGAPGSGQVAQIAVSGAAILAGGFDVDLVNGFTPTVGQDFSMLLYANATGSFASINQLPANMTAGNNATEFDLDTVSSAPITWISPGGGNWDDPANWSTGTLPSSSDVVTISTAANATISIQSADDIQIKSVTTSSTDTLSISGGSLMVTAGQSMLNGPLLMTGGSLTASGTDVNLTALSTTDVSAASLNSLAGATVNFPQLTSYVSNGTKFIADGASSELNVSALTNVTQQGLWEIDATNGGTLNLGALTSLTSTKGIQITDTGSSMVLDGALTSLVGVDTTTDGTDSPLAVAWASYTGGITVTGGTVTLPKVSSATFSAFELSNGSKLSLPVSAANATSTGTMTISAGAVLAIAGKLTLTSSSTLDEQIGGAPASGQFGQIAVGGAAVLAGTFSLGLLNSFTPSIGQKFAVMTFASVIGAFSNVNGLTTPGSSFTEAVEATSLNLTGAPPPPTFTADTPPAGTGELAYSYQFVATATGSPPITYSATGLPSWAVLNASTGLLTGTPNAVGTFDFTVTASDGVLPNTTVNVDLLVAGGNAVRIDVAAGATFVVPAGTYTGGTTLNAGAGASVTIPGGCTFTGGVSFNVATGAVVDLTGDGSSGYTGTLSGSGSGTVQLVDGFLYINAGSLTLNFPDGMFQWTGGSINPGNGDLINLGMMTLSGGAPKEFHNNGTLENFGTIIQSGAGYLSLGTDGTSPVSLINESGASYLLEGDTGLSEVSATGTASGEVTLNNAGTIAKTSGTGTFSFDLLGSISNTGTIEADSGTIALNPALGIAQINDSTLTGGTWNAEDGAALQFPAGTSIDTNAANLTLSGGPATISGLSELTSSSGSFTLKQGAVFSTAGSLTNSGTLTIGAGSTLTVNGNETETSAATLDLQIGGTPSSGEFGQVVTTGRATLAGALDLELVNSFAASVGQVFPAMTFASSSGSFSTANLGSSFIEKLNSASLDLNSTAANPTDLSLMSVTAPTTATAGQEIAVTWQVKNESVNNTNAIWKDSVFLSLTPTITSNSILLGAAQRGGGLNANATYEGILSEAVPAIAPGSYYVIVQVDSLYQVSDPSRANNTLAASNLVNVGIPALALGTPGMGSFASADQNRYYQISAPPGGSLVIAVTSAASSGALALYVSESAPPTPYNFQQSATVANQPDQSISLPNILAFGTYYLLVHSVSGSAAAAGFTITATQSTVLAVSSVSPNSGGNSGDTTIAINGSNFAANATATLTEGTTTLDATAIEYVNESQIYATFNLAGVNAGTYMFSVQQGTYSAAAPTNFQVIATSVANPLVLDLNTPSYVRVGGVGVAYVTVTNQSMNDVPAPLLVLSSTGATLSLPSNPAFTSSSLTFLATSATGLPGVLTAGETVTVPIDFTSTTTDPLINFQLNPTDTTQPFDWSQITAGVAEYESDVTNASAALTYLENEVGSTWGDYVSMLDKNADLIPQQLGSPNDPKALFSLEFDEALAAVNTSLSGTLETVQPGLNLAGLSVYATDTTSGAAFAAISLNDGSFVFSTLPAGTYTLSADGVLLTSNTAFTVGAGQSMTGIVLAVTEGAQIVGQVLSQSSLNPIAGATIQATNEAGGAGYTVVTDANGNYDIAGLPAGTYDLVVNATGYAQGETLGVDVTTGNATEPFTLTTQSLISGTIALAFGGAAESTLYVSASISGSTDANQTFSSSSTSTAFTVSGLPAGTYDVTFSLSGYITQTISSVVVTAGQTMNLRTITLDPASEIDGTITSTDPNNPAGQMPVQALEGTTVVGQTLADASGNFQILNLPSGTYTLAVPEATGDFVTAPVVTVAIGQTVTGQSIQVVPGGEISGSVTQTVSGTPITGIPVYIDGPGGFSETTNTDSNGSYDFSGLAAGSYEVYLLIGGSQTSQTVSVSSTQPTATANLELAYFANLGGTVTDASGNPISDGVVTLYDAGSPVATASTEASGAYSFLIIQPGTYDLSAVASEGTFNVVTGIGVNAGSSVTVNLQAGDATLICAVTDGIEPITGDTVLLQGIVEGSMATLEESTVAADGTASFAGMVPSNYTILATGSGNDFGQATVDISSNQSVNTNLAMSPQAGLSGVVTDNLGIALDSATVIVQSTNGQAVLSTVTAADGSYSIAGIAQGSYDVTVIADGFLANTRVGVQVATSATVNAMLLPSTTTINGTVADATGNPVPNGTVTITDSSGHIIGIATVSPDGSFQVTTAQGSDLSLEISTQGYAPASMLVFTAIPGSVVSLTPIVLEPVALDPGSSNQPNLADANAGSSGEQAYAHNIEVASDRIVTFAEPLEPKPACASCDSSYAIYKEAVENLSNEHNVVEFAQFAVGFQAVGLTLTAYTEIFAASSIQGLYLATLFDLDAGVKNPLIGIAVALGGDVVRKIQEIGQTLPALQSAANDLMNADSPEKIQAAADDAKAAIAKETTLVKDLIGYLVSQLAVMGLSTRIPVLEQSEPAKAVAAALIEKALEKPLEWAQSLLRGLVSDPFANTAIQAKNLFNDNAVLQQDFDDWKDGLANYNDAYAALLHCEHTMCQPSPPPGNPAHRRSSGNENSGDPNALIGPSGYGTLNFVQPTGIFPYTVDFENDGTAAAQNVIVTQQLDSNLDWSTFQLGSFGFGSVHVAIPAGLTQYQTVVSYENTDGSALNVEVSLDFNVQTGLLTVTFTSLDPTTGEAPAGVFDGFLPPNNSTGIGDGFVEYTVDPKTSLATGTTISQQASVVFDTNASIATNIAVNAIDNSPPTSSVKALPAITTSPSFAVTWTGNDGAGPGIAGYNVYVATNGGAFVLWQSDTTATSATYTGQANDSYSFYSVAIDDLGIVQPTPVAPQASTVVKLPVPTPTPTPSPTATLPGPLITVTGVSEVLNKKHQVTEVVVNFSGALNASEASLPAIYRLAMPGKKGSYTAKNATVIKLKSASYSAAKDQVTLTARKPFALTKPVQLAINGLEPSGLQDAEGGYIDGDHNGTAGGNAIVVFSKRGAVIDARTDVRTKRPGGLVDVIDAVLARGEPFRDVRLKHGRVRR